jgi:hypothetical protein
MYLFYFQLPSFLSFYDLERSFVHRIHTTFSQSRASPMNDTHQPMFSRPDRAKEAKGRHYFVLSHTTTRTHPIIITMARPKKGGRPKRQQWQTEEQNETVDDLAHAAMFAIVPPVVAPTVPDVEDDKEDDNEIEMTEDEADSSGDEDSKSEKEENKNDEDEDDGDDSDVDLAEAVAKMQEADDDEPTKGAGAPPKTQNEVDAYQTPIEDLENHLEFQLTVQDDDDAIGKPLLRNLDASNLSLAGRVKHNMLLDRTVVVESMAPENGTFSAPLDEGSLLVIRQTEATPGTPNLIPLGRIFEVFGPVSQPLYTIRLPPPPSAPSKKTPTTKKDSLEKEESKQLEKQVNEGFPSSDTPDSETPTPEEQNEITTENDKETTKTEGATANEKNATPESKGVDTIEGTKDAESLVVSKPKLKDRWAPDGEYSQLLRNNKAIAVYYVQDEAKLIDTGAVMRMSGKGCGMSSKFVLLPVFFL